MTPVVVGLILLGLLLVVVAAFIWQGMKRSLAYDTAIYWMPEAVRFVRGRLPEEVGERLSDHDLRLILEWGVHYHQVVAPREEGHRPVIGSGDAIAYIRRRGRESAKAYDSEDIAQVIAAETEYLVEIGAVGGPVEDEKP